MIFGNRKQRREAARHARTSDAVHDVEQEFRKFLASGQAPDADVAALADPEIRDELAAYLRTLGELRTLLVAFAFQRDQVAPLVAALTAFEAAHRAYEAAATRSRLRIAGIDLAMPVTT